MVFKTDFYNFEYATSIVNVIYKKTSKNAVYCNISTLNGYIPLKKQMVTSIRFFLKHVKKKSMLII